MVFSLHGGSASESGQRDHSSIPAIAAREEWVYTGTGMAGWGGSRCWSATGLLLAAIAALATFLLLCHLCVSDRFSFEVHDR